MHLEETAFQDDDLGVIWVSIGPLAHPVNAVNMGSIEGSIFKIACVSAA
jgi:hypothetical protein